MDVLLRLLPFLPAQILALIQAIAALRKTGVAEADVAALVQALTGNILALNADTIATLADIPLPAPK